MPLMYVNRSCGDLYIDINNTLYCSMWAYHQVIKKRLDDVTNITMIAVGTGCSGFLPNMLYMPCGVWQ